MSSACADDDHHSFPPIDPARGPRCRSHPHPRRRTMDRFSTLDGFLSFRQPEGHASRRPRLRPVMVTAAIALGSLVALTPASSVAAPPPGTILALQGATIISA